jgi:hypothetical protein
VRPGEPRLDHEIAQLLAVETGQLRNTDEDGRVAAEVRRRKADAASVGEQELLHAEVGDAEHQHVAEPLPGIRID